MTLSVSCYPRQRLITSQKLPRLVCHSAEEVGSLTMPPCHQSYNVVIDHEATHASLGCRYLQTCNVSKNQLSRCRLTIGDSDYSTIYQAEKVSPDATSLPPVATLVAGDGRFDYQRLESSWMVVVVAVLESRKMCQLRPYLVSNGK